MRRRRLILVSVAVTSIGALTGAFAGSGGLRTAGIERRHFVVIPVAARRAAAGITTSGVPARCPRTPVDPRAALPLPAESLGPAADAALRYFEAPHNAISGLYKGAIAQTASRQPPPERSTALYLCGERIASRTVLVDVSFPQAKKTGSASLAFGIVLVSRFARHGYLVWFQVH